VAPARAPGFRDSVSIARFSGGLLLRLALGEGLVEEAAGGLEAHLLLDEAGGLGGAELAAAQIASAAAQGDAVCQASLQRYATRLARALAGVINLLDPDVIVLAGGLSKIDLLYTQVPRLWGRWVVSGGLQDEVRTRLLPSRHGDASGVRGAAWLWR